MVEWQRNPMQLVEIKGISKRKKKPVVLTVEQYYLILALIPPPYRTMVMVAQCTGLRAEEVLALEWEDIDFENLSMRARTKQPRCRAFHAAVGTPWLRSGDPSPGLTSGVAPRVHSNRGRHCRLP
jgi:site-specific recombinase XerD